MNYYNYFTEIEEHFVRRRGKHLMISPMDWGLIAAWKDAGIPLQVALRGIDMAMDSFASRQRSNSKVNTLAYCHDSVIAEFANHLESHVGEAADNPPTPDSGSSTATKDEPDIQATIHFISERIGEIKGLEAKQLGEKAAEGIQRVLERLDEVLKDINVSGRMDPESLEHDLSIIDDVFAAELRAAIPADRMQEWEAEAKKELKVYKKNLPKETFEKIHSNFIRDRIHRNFKIGELSIFRL
jgi:hypothetical protein